MANGFYALVSAPELPLLTHFYTIALLNFMHISLHIQGFRQTLDSIQPTIGFAPLVRICRPVVRKDRELLVELRNLFMRGTAFFLVVILLAVNGCVSPRRVVNSGGGSGGGSN